MAGVLNRLETKRKRTHVKNSIMAWLYCQCFVTESLHMEEEGKRKELRASEEVRTKDVNLGTTCIGKRLLSNESLWSLRKSKRARTEPWEYRPPCVWPSAALEMQNSRTRQSISDSGQASLQSWLKPDDGSGVTIWCNGHLHRNTCFLI